MIVKNEINWLTRHFKGYSVPLVVVDLSSVWQGYYDWDIDQFVVIGGQEYYNEFGIIVLSDLVASTIAHEYRHHLQFWRHGYWEVPGGMENDWDLQVSYYLSCPQEHDAMMFERSMDECKNEDESFFSLCNVPKSRQMALELF